MKQTLIPLGALVALIAQLASAQAVTIPIPNSGFEANILGCSPGSDCFNTELTAWLPGWYNTGNVGTFKPGPVQYPGGVPQGVNIAWLGSGSAGGKPLTGGIFQTLPAKLQANRTYTLRLSVGHRAEVPFTGYVATLLAGSVPVAYDDSLSPASGTFLEDVIVYNSGPNPPLLGQLLSISIRNVGTGQLNIDNLSLTVQ